MLLSVSENKRRILKLIKTKRCHFYLVLTLLYSPIFPLVAQDEWVEYESTGKVVAVRGSPMVPHVTDFVTKVKVSLFYNVNGSFDSKLDDGDPFGECAYYDNVFTNIVVSVENIGVFELAFAGGVACESRALGSSIGPLEPNRFGYPEAFRGPENIQILVGDNQYESLEFAGFTLGANTYDGGLLSGSPLKLAPLDIFDKAILDIRFTKVSSSILCQLSEFVRVNPESPVNLVGATFDVIDSRSSGGKTIALSFSIENRGSIGTSGFEVSFYLSGNKLINDEKDFLTKVTMPGIEAGGVSSLTSLNISLPTEILKAGVPLDDGVFYIGMVIDPRNNIDESNEKDNSSLGRGRDYDSITILDSAGIRPIKFDAHHIGHDGEAFSPGDTIVIDWQLQNFGYGNAVDFFLKFLIDFPVATELGDGFLGKKLLSLKSGEIASGSFQGTMPPDGSLVYKFKGNTTLILA